MNGLRACGCPKNLYNVSKSYFRQRTAILSSNSIRLQKTVSKGFPQGSCYGPGFWNLQYNSLLNFACRAKTKPVAFADDLILGIRGDTASDVENYSNGEMRKITACATRNKIRFNDEKSKAMLVTRIKRKEPRVINVYLNNKILEQVTTMKYPGIILDHKFTFKEHITYVAEICAKLIHSLSRSAKVSWGIKHEAMKTTKGPFFSSYYMELRSESTPCNMNTTYENILGYRC